MKNFLFPLALLAVLSLPIPALARNPAVQPIFFEQLDNALPASEPAPVGQNGDVTEVTLAGLAWAVENLKNDHVPLVVELYSSDANDCAVTTQTGANQCLSQETATPAAAAKYQGRVRFLRIDVRQYPILLNGPDVRVLPTHIVLADYADTSHYTAIKVWGYLSQSQLQSLVKEILSLDP